jgi:hypothetical protein
MRTCTRLDWKAEEEEADLKLLHRAADICVGPAC